MANLFRKVAMPMLGAAVFAGCFAGELRIGSSSGASLIASADARVGRPLTPVSYAGVARRTTRRAVVATSVARPVVVVAPAPTCVDTVNAYGTVTRVCR